MWVQLVELNSLVNALWPEGSGVWCLWRSGHNILAILTHVKLLLTHWLRGLLWTAPGQYQYPGIGQHNILIQSTPRDPCGLYLYNLTRINTLILYAELYVMCNAIMSYWNKIWHLDFFHFVPSNISLIYAMQK